MATLVFDIETVGTPWESLDARTQTDLTKWIATSYQNPDEADAALEKVKAQLALSPLTGSIVSLALYDLERNEGVVYVVGGDGTETITESGYVIKVRTEKELLEAFWEGCRSYDVFVTFNGRQFDIPFLLHRSVANEVRPSIEMVKHKYLNQQSYPYHVDLMEELTFHRSMPRRSSLYMFCQAYGITVPEESGAVADLVKAKDFIKLANYNAADVEALRALYETWKQYLAPASFINSVEM